MAQSGRRNIDSVTPMRVAIGLKGGVAMTTARGIFPSLIIGDSKSGSGDIPASLAGSGTGTRFDLEAQIPVDPLLAFDLEFGTLHYVASYDADSSHLATRFEAQTLQLLLGAQLNLLNDSYAFATSGLRNIYLGGGLDLGLATVANRVESQAFPDSAAPAVSRAGSFENSQPFRTAIGVRGSLGMHFGLSPHIEVQPEFAYTHTFNKVFSNDVVRDNDFAVDHMSVQIGVEYRF